MTKDKRLLVGLLTCLMTITGVAGATIFWSRTISHDLAVIGIEGELLLPTLDGYRYREVAVILTDERVALVIDRENFQDIWLDITWTSDAEGLAITASGQYWQCHENIAGAWLFEPVGESFDVLGYHVVDKTQMMYSPATKNDPVGGLLMVTFTFDTEAVTVPGSYTAQLQFEMGFS